MALKWSISSCYATIRKKEGLSSLPDYRKLLTRIICGNLACGGMSSTLGPDAPWDDQLPTLLL